MINRFGASPLHFPRSLNTMQLASVIAAGTVVSGQSAQSPAPAVKAPAPSPTRFAAMRKTEYYTAVWGMDSFAVKSVESGEPIRFTYRVVDGKRAEVINDKKNEAYLILPAAHVERGVPSVEKVGQLRQSSAPIVGNTTGGSFSDSGRPVKPGDRVDIEIGQSNLQGLLVQ